MALTQQQEKQIDLIKKLDHEFFDGLAAGKEPLSYTTKSDDTELQVEVNAYYEGEKLLLCIDFDTNGGGRWNQSTAAANFEIHPNGKWSSILE